MKGYFNTSNVEIMYNLGTKANNFELNKFTLMKNLIL